MAATSTDLYQYKPLPSPTHVRRLQIVQNEPEKGLYFLISEFDQDDASAPPYHCLSYTWGNPLDCEADPNVEDEWSEKHQIYIRGDGKDWREFFVTTNLYEFLCEYSSKALSAEVPSEVSWIWIDAICIDQANEFERSVQVGLMRKVYLSCAEVIIWLGREMDDIECITVFLAKIEGQHWITDNDQLEHFKRSKYRPDVLGYAQWSWTRDLTRKFLRRSWFHRVWTMQESILPSKGQIWCGSWHYTDMKTFPMIGPVLALYFDKSESSSPEHIPSINAVDYLHNFLFARQYGDGHRNDLKGPLKFLGGTTSLYPIDCLRASRAKKCSASHDSIYATLGLQREQLVRADYKMTKKELFIRVALHPCIICYALEEAGLGSRPISKPQGRSGSPLTQVDSLKVEEPYARVEPGKSDYVDDLPSWVPDWSSTPSAEPWTRHRRFIDYKSGGGVFRNFTMTHLPGNIVQVVGLCEDEVAFLGGDGTPPITIESLLESLHLLRNVAAQASSTLFVGNIVGRLAKTLVTGRQTIFKVMAIHPSDPAKFIAKQFREYLKQKFNQLARRLSEEDYNKKADELRRDLEELRDDGWESCVDRFQIRDFPVRENNAIRAAEYAGGLAKYFHMRRFFITKKGRMGIASHITEVGDAIMILKNCEFPFTMRKGTQGCWKLISQAYVEDIMHGEALEGRQFEDILIE